MTEQLLTEIRDLLVLLVKAEAHSKGLDWLTEEEFVRDQLRHFTQEDGPQMPPGFEDRLRERYRRDGGYRQLSHRAPGLRS